MFLHINLEIKNINCIIANKYLFKKRPTDLQITSIILMVYKVRWKQLVEVTMYQLSHKYVFLYINTSKYLLNFFMEIENFYIFEELSFSNVAGIMGTTFLIIIF